MVARDVCFAMGGKGRLQQRDNKVWAHRGFQPTVHCLPRQDVHREEESLRQTWLRFNIASVSSVEEDGHVLVPSVQELGLPQV